MKIYNNTFVITDEALKAIHQFLENRDCYVPIRVGVKTSFKNFLECAESINDDDVQLYFGDVVIVIDELSAHLLNGAVLHWRDNETGKGFKLHNPSESFWRTFSQCFGWLS